VAGGTLALLNWPTAGSCCPNPAARTAPALRMEARQPGRGLRGLAR
jgi:hypothetical protein